MKKILLFSILFICLKSFGQYPVKQTIGSDSTLVESKGAIKSRFVNKVFLDTNAANAQRIKYYDGAQIYTNSAGGQLWLRDSTLNKWTLTGGGGSGETNTASNLAGDGVGIWKDKLSFDLRFKRLKAGSNVTIQDMTDSVKINASGDTTWAYVDDYVIGDDNLEDSTGIKQAIATGKNVRFGPHVYINNANLVPAHKGQIFEGQGKLTVLKFSKDTVNCFNLSVGKDSCIIRYITFKGTGKTTFPGGTLTYQNAIFYESNGNIIDHCDFYDVKGSCAYSFNISGGCYGNQVAWCTFMRSTVGIFPLLGSEYGNYINNLADSNTIAYFDRRSGNNRWNNNSAKYNGIGFQLDGTNGDNGDHGGCYNSVFNHNTTAIRILGCYRGYEFIGIHVWFDNIDIGYTDTAKNVIFLGCEIANATITTTKALRCQMSGGSWPVANTVVGTSGINFCNILNSPYENKVCGLAIDSFYKNTAQDSIKARWNDGSITTIKDSIGTYSGGGSPLLNPMTTDQDIIVAGSSGTPNRLPVGTDGQFLGVVAGVVGWTNNVNITGTPVDNQVTIWKSASSVEGDPNFTWDGAKLVVGGFIETDTINGGTAAGSNIVYKSTSGTGTLTGMAHKFIGGTNGATTLGQINNDGMWGIGGAPFTNARLYIQGGTNSGSDYAIFMRNLASNNLFYVGLDGSTFIGNFSTQTSVNTLYGQTKLFNTNAGGGGDSFYVKKTSTGYIGTIAPPSNVLADFYTDINNVGTGETDFYTYTTPANTLASDGEKLIAQYAGTYNDATATEEWKVYFAGNVIGDDGPVGLGTTGQWKIDVTIIRTGSSTARSVVTVTAENAAIHVYQTDITGITFSNTNIIKCTGTAASGTGGSNDITAKLGYVEWKNKAN